MLAAPVWGNPAQLLSAALKEQQAKKQKTPQIMTHCDTPV